MLYRFFLVSFILVFLLLICVYIRGAIAARMIWANGQPHIFVELSNPRMGLKHSFKYSGHGLILPALENLPQLLSSLDKVITRLNHAKKMGSLCIKLLVIQELEWKSVLGCGDAMGTALANGSLWGFKGMLIAVVSSKTRVEKLDLMVRPDFTQKCLESQLHCIFKMRIAHIIFVTAYFLGLGLKRQIEESLHSLQNRWG